MTTENKKLIMFDFDGVLIDTLFVCYEINKQLDENLSIDEYRDFSDHNIYDAIRNGLVKRPHPNFGDEYDIYTRDLTVQPLLKQIIATLADSYTMAIVSSTQSSSINNILAREGIAQYFGDIMGSDIHKSKIKKIEMLLEKYSINPDETVLVTDTLGDINEAGECGVPSIAVTWGWHERFRLEKGNPAIILENPMDLAAAIVEILKP